jgi:uncharacterized membrane protein
MNVTCLHTLACSYVEAYGQGEFDGYGSGHDFYGVRHPRVHVCMFVFLCVCVCLYLCVRVGCAQTRRESQKESMRAREKVRERQIQINTH